MLSKIFYIFDLYKKPLNTLYETIMQSAKKKSKIKHRKLQKEKLAKKEAYHLFVKHFKPLLYAVSAWLLVNAIIHLPFLKKAVNDIFVSFTLNAAVIFGKLLFIPVERLGFPIISVGGYNMIVVMECTAYNFYIFVVFLSLFSPGAWKHKLITLLIFLSSIFVINNFRFYTMGFLGNNYPAQLHAVHDYMWNILFGVFIYIVWLWRYRGLKSKSIATVEVATN